MFGSLVVWLALIITTLSVFIPEFIFKTVSIRLHETNEKEFNKSHFLGHNENRQTQIQANDLMEGGEMSTIKPVNFSGQGDTGFRTSINQK